MPNFPNINTLITKANLTGDEVIQISATEKVTLKQIAEQLAVNGTLSNYTGEELNIVENVISSSDTIIEALEKLEARVGGKRYVILPLEGLSTSQASIQGVIMVGMKTSTQVEIVGIYQLREDNISNWTVKKLTLAPNTPLDSSQGTLSTLWNYLNTDSDTRTFYISTNDVLGNIVPGVVTIKPGDVLTGSNFSSIKFDSSWLDTQSQYHATIVTSVNVTKSMFNRSTPTTITPYFSTDFDDDPGTALQAVCMQLIGKSSSGMSFIINKCGYDG